ncbi:MAG: hypothetical protein LBT97_05590 [Planctomycetota bacterium]|jgi:V/A-type H+-transporting ATPase subunit E|nr:hypothetical protein [Planctomycetota bacterium]
MGLETIKTTVLETAEKRAQAILAEAEGEAGRILAEASAAAGRTAAEAVRDAKLRVERQTNRELERIQHDNRRQMLQARNDAINEVFKRVGDTLSAMSDDDYVGLVGKWLAALPKDAGGTLRVNPEDEEKFASRLGTLNKGRGKDGKFIGVTADPKVDAGVVVDGPDYAIDCTIGRRLSELRETAAGAVAKALFG